jgi:hypothetical protein
MTAVFTLVAALALGLTGACDNSSACCLVAGTGGSGTGGGGAGGTGRSGIGGDCQYPNYRSPGCGGNAVRICEEGAGGAIYCTKLACGCDGKITQGCVPNLSVPYAYALPDGVDAGYHAGDMCDPTADAGP